MEFHKKVRSSLNHLRSDFELLGLFLAHCTVPFIRAPRTIIT
jgi:hypothetical protein